VIRIDISSDLRDMVDDLFMTLGKRCLNTEIYSEMLGAMYLVLMGFLCCY